MNTIRVKSAPFSLSWMAIKEDGEVKVEVFWGTKQECLIIAAAFVQVGYNAIVEE